MSSFAEFLLREAYARNAPEETESAVQKWSDALLLDGAEKEYVLKLANLDLDTIKLVKELVQMPAWVPIALHRAYEETSEIENKVKRQRTAKPSSIKDLEDVLRTVVVKRVLTFTTSPDFVEPTKEALQEAAEALRRSLFTDLNMAPEQPAREFLANCKVLLRQTCYHSEVRMPGDLIKRADAVTASEGLSRGIMELKKHIPSTGTDEFNRTVAQIAVYVATGFYDAPSVPFVILTGFKSRTGATFNATFGVCNVEKNRQGAIYVKEILHEEEVTEVHFRQRGNEVRFEKADFVDVLARISALGQHYTEYAVEEETIPEAE